jgi:glucose-6-phosphate isomerase
MNKLKLNLNNIQVFIDKDEIHSMQPFVDLAHSMLREGSGLGSEFLGWIDLPGNYDKNELQRVKTASEKIRKNCDAFIVIGIGGSYLGARSAIDMLSHNFYNFLDKNKRKSPMIFYVGNNMSSAYIAELLEVVEGMDICVNVISKSGTTTESAVAFRIFKELIEKKYGKEGARERIFCTTDKANGALKTMSDEQGYESFVIPENVGGRYSVLTSVGLLPIAVADIDIEEILAGAKDAMRDFENPDLLKNDAYTYAAIRNILYKKGKNIEIIANFEPSLHYFGEWCKQLFGESEGKNGMGIFPAAVDFTTDLHSIGQYIQDGRREIFETFINIERPRKDFTIKVNKDNLDGLNYLQDKSIDFVNKQAYKGTVLAHNDGSVPALTINIPELSPYHYGYTVYFFELSCALSGYLMGVNPFDQPGVEAYKNNMFALLGKPGYEELNSKLKDRI